MKSDLYSILELSPRASHEVIHASYRILAKQHKDDQKKLRALNEAKDTLLDETKRAEYDLELNGPTKNIGPYRVSSVIAEGGFGKTYKAEHEALGVPVCIKHASKVSPQDEQILMEEAKAIWDLRHYGLPNIRDILRLPDGSLALAMSYIPGPTLHQVIEKNKKLDPEDVCWIVERVLNVLKYIHFNGVVHGDIKPANIIIQPDKHMIVVVDFGLSLIRPSGKDVNKGYTPYFAPPEQKDGNVLLPETDFYSLGLTMIAALGGNVKDKQVPKDTPPHLCNFIRKLIKFEVLARPRWQDEDLITSLQDVRKKEFGRTSSNMKPLKY